MDPNQTYYYEINVDGFTFETVVRVYHLEEVENKDDRGVWYTTKTVTDYVEYIPGNVEGPDRTRRIQEIAERYDAVQR